MIIRSDGKTFKSIDEAFGEMRKEDPKFKKYNLKCCIQGKRKTAGGFGWEEKELLENHNPEEMIGTAEIKEIEEGLEVHFKPIETVKSLRYEPGQPGRMASAGSFEMTPGQIDATDVERTPSEVKEALKILGIELVQGLGVVFANYIEEGSLRPGYITLKDLSQKLMWNDGKLRGYSRYRQLIGDMPNDIKDKVGSTYVVNEAKAKRYI